MNDKRDNPYAPPTPNVQVENGEDRESADREEVAQNDFGFDLSMIFLGAGCFLALLNFVLVFLDASESSLVTGISPFKSEALLGSAAAVVVISCLFGLRVYFYYSTKR